MKLAHIAQLTMLVSLVTFAATGCKHHAPPVTQLDKPGTTQGQNPELGSGSALTGSSDLSSTTGIPANAPGSHDGWAQNPNALQADIVYFHYDSAEVQSDEKSKLSAVASYLKSSSGDALKIEGFCDERGTEEYNRSLGERRALALREELASLGIDPSRVDTASLGKDRPADPGHSESAWSKNRRGEFIVLSPPK
jgi:outer membrane protein OmpA-like peptidoglycan-associated protein